MGISAKIIVITGGTEGMGLFRSDGAFSPTELISARYEFHDVARAYAEVAGGRITGRALIRAPRP